MRMKIQDFRDSVRTHPFEFVVCILSILAAWSIAHILITHPETLRTARSGFLSLPPTLLWIWCIWGAIGSLLLLAAFVSAVFSNHGRIVETAGLWLIGSNWLSAGVSAFIFQSSDWVEYVYYLTIALGCAIRLSALHQFRIIRARLERMIH